MTTRQTLRYAPIKHAIIDFRVIADQPADHKALNGAAAASGLIDLKQSRPVELQFGFVMGREPTARQTFGAVNGTGGFTPDKLYSVQFLDNQFSITRNGKYKTFADFKMQANLFWDKYVAARGTCSVQRVGLRFINHFRIQQGAPDAVRMLETRPVIAADKYGYPSEFVSRALLQMSDAKATAIVNQAWNRAEDGWVHVVLDIDVFRMASLPSTDGDGIWQQVEDLRHAKNDLFFGSFKEEALRPFQ